MLRVATRGSALARWQADHVALLLRAVEPSVEIEMVVVETRGDRDTSRPLAEIGGKGVFVKEVQAAVIGGRADLAVHSAKDLPSATPAGLVLAAVPLRGDPRDALVGNRLADLPQGGAVATGSARRRVQLSALRPDLTFSDLRGNIATRLEKAAGFDAIVVAVAALSRLQLLDRVGELLDASVLVPQVGQGALAVECREDDEQTLEALARIEHAPSRRAVDTERAFLATLGGDCDLPAGGHAVVRMGERPGRDLFAPPDCAVPPEGELVFEGLLASLDGHVVRRERRCGDDPVALGTGVARHLLDDAGGAALLSR